jgi:hypothetical protein
MILTLMSDRRGLLNGAGPSTMKMFWARRFMAVMTSQSSLHSPFFHPR